MRKSPLLWAMAFLAVWMLRVGHAADAPKPPPFESEIKAFEAADAKEAPPQGAVLFVGSSSIRMWKTLAKDFPNHKVINRGFGGSQVQDSIRYAERIVIPYHPRQIVFYAGDNDIAAGKTPRQVADAFKAFVERVRKDLPGVRIDFIAIKPSLARMKLMDPMREANGMIQAYARTAENVGFIDVFGPMLGEDGKPRAELFIKDGLHMNEKGYALWTGIIRDRLLPEPK